MSPPKTEAMTPGQRRLMFFLTPDAPLRPSRAAKQLGLPSDRLRQERYGGTFQPVVRRASPDNETRKELQTTVKGSDAPRKLVCWRVLRTIAIIRGIIEPNAMLNDIFVVGSGGDPLHAWLVGDPMGPPPPSLGAEFLPVLKALNNLTMLRWNGLLPPPPPDGAKPETYDPARDERLKAHCRAMHIAAMVLGVYEGSPENSSLGRIGMAGLVEPRLVHLCFPSPVEIVSFERELVEEMMKLSIQTSKHHAASVMENAFGLNSFEVQSLETYANRRLLLRWKRDEETNRAIMMERLEDYRLRALIAHNLRDEAFALKEMARIQGLTAEGANQSGGFQEIARRAMPIHPADTGKVRRIERRD